MSARDDIIAEVEAGYECGAPPEAEIDALLDRHRAEVLREAADWIETHDPVDELTWFVAALRDGLVGHQCKQCYDPNSEQP